MSGKCRIIGRRASPEQKEALLQYLEENLMFANFLCDSPNANEVLRQQWESLADMLNKIGGAHKLGPSWRKYWFDLREYTKKRMDTVNSADNGEYKKMIKNLSAAEQRIISIISWRRNAMETDSKFDIIKLDSDDKYMADIKGSRIKTGRASELQKQELIQYFEDNPDAIRVASNMVGDSKVKQRVWIELTHRLNGIDGVMKTSSKWAKYWNDIVNYTRNRAKRALSSQVTASNDRPPTEIERRMLTIVGQKYLVNHWTKYWTEISSGKYEIKKEHNFEVDEEESEWVDLSNDGIDESHDQSENIDDAAADSMNDHDNQLIDVTQDLQTEQQLQIVHAAATDEFENVCYELDGETTIEFAECNESYYQISSQQQSDDATIYKEAIANTEDKTETIQIVDENNIIIDEGCVENVASNEDENVFSPPRKKVKYEKEPEETSNSNQPQLQQYDSINDEGAEESNNSEDNNEDLSTAVYALSAAASSLAVALKGLAKVLGKRKFSLK